MINKFGFFVLLILCINIVSATDYIQVINVTTDSFGGLVSESGSMYVGSIIRYNISLYNPNGLNSPKFEVVIVGPSYDVIENQTFEFNGVFLYNYSLISNVTKNESKLIYADVPGIYKLVLSSKINVQLFENKSNAWRHSLSLPFYFEVKSLEEKRLTDANDRLIKRNEDIAKQSENINKNMLNYTKYTFIASIVMLIVAIITLFSTSEGIKTFSRFVKFSILAVLILISYIFITKFLSSP